MAYVGGGGGGGETQNSTKTEEENMILLSNYPSLLCPFHITLYCKEYGSRTGETWQKLRLLITFKLLLSFVQTSEFLAN